MGIGSTLTRLTTSVVLLLLAVAPRVAEAQQAGKIYRIGVFFASNPTAAGRNSEAFTQALRELGYVEGQNVVLERRYGEARTERMAEVAAELVRMKPDVIVARTDQPITAVKRQTQSIPIVMVNATDPVGTGFVASLDHPGGNITGISTMSPELSGKRLELLREAVPRLSRVAVIWNPDVRGAVLEYKELEGPARSLRVKLQSVEVSRADVLSVSHLNDFADSGGLMSYGPNLTEIQRRAAGQVARILKGAKVADLPVERPTVFELVLNRKTAATLGIAFPRRCYCARIG